MSFTRTNSGLANYPVFFNADLLVYIEGKTNAQPGELIPDMVFYESLLSLILKNKKIKIKCVGSKKSVFAYLNKLKNAGINNSFVIVDRDYDGALCSIIKDPMVVYTYGYSWENDFWSIQLITKLITTITVGNLEAVSKIINLHKKLNKRLKFLSLLDGSSQINGENVLKKSIPSCGIGFSMNKNSPIPRSEMRRVLVEFKSSKSFTDSCVREYLRELSRLEPMKVIQGHFWENTMLTALSSVYKEIYSGAALPSKALKLLALSAFKANPLECMGSTFNYYSDLVCHWN